jgi:hypothetical protein
MVGAPVKEKATGIMFPQLCNGMNLVGMYFYSFRSTRMPLARTWIQPIALDRWHQESVNSSA